MSVPLWLSIQISDKQKSYLLALITSPNLEKCEPFAVHVWNKKNKSKYYAEKILTE